LTSTPPPTPHTSGYITVSREWCMHAVTLPSKAASRAAFGVLCLPFVRHELGWHGSMRQFSRATQIPQNGRLLHSLVIAEKAGLIKMRRRRGCNGLSIHVVDPWLDSEDAPIRRNLELEDAPIRREDAPLCRNNAPIRREDAPICRENATPVSHTEEPEVNRLRPTTASTALTNKSYFSITPPTAEAGAAAAGDGEAPGGEARTASREVVPAPAAAAASPALPPSIVPTSPEVEAVVADARKVTGGDVSSSALLSRIGKVGLEAVRQQVEWFPHRDSSWVKKGLGAALVSYIDGNKAAPPALAAASCSGCSTSRRGKSQGHRRQETARG
jgi:hypothetical protein